MSRDCHDEHSLLWLVVLLAILNDSNHPPRQTVSEPTTAQGIGGCAAFVAIVAAIGLGGVWLTQQHTPPTVTGVSGPAPRATLVSQPASFSPAPEVRRAELVQVPVRRATLVKMP